MATPAPPRPAPSPLITALRKDNKLLATELLRLDPTATDELEEQERREQQPSNNASVGFKQRLVFADEALRNLFFRQILGGDEDAAANSKKKKKPKAAATADDLPIPRGLGIVGTRLLSRSGGSADHRYMYQQGDGSAEDEFPLHDSTSLYPDLADKDALLRSTGATGTAAAFAPHPAEDPRDATDGADVIVYLLRPDALQTRAAARRLKRYAQQSSRGPGGDAVRHRIVYFPRGNALCDRVLLDEGVLPLESVTVHSLPIDIVPLDSDVLSMERPEVLRRVTVDGLPSDSITAVARSLVTLQDCGGPVRRIQALGPMAEAVLARTMAMRVEDHAAEQDHHQDQGFGDGDAAAGGVGSSMAASSSLSQIDAMMIFDRKIDMVTPMLTPLTYEGLLDEVLGIDCGLVHVDAAVIEPPESDEDKAAAAAAAAAGEKGMVSVSLNDADTLYAEVRDQHVEKFGSFLKQQAQALKATHSDFTDKNRDLSEIHQFVKQIPIFTQNLRSLTHHILLAELVKSATEESGFRQRWQTERSMVESETCYDVLEDLISAQAPPLRVLRLLCLQSLTGGGIKSSRFDALRRDIVQTYGFEFVVILNNLETAGLLRRKETVFALDSASPFATLRKHLRLINAEVNTTEPDDVSYVSSGYAPLTARLVEIAVTIGWAGKDEALRELPGRLVDINQQNYPPEELSSATKRNPGPSLGNLARSKGGDAGGGGGKKPVLLVCFVGGVSFMEIAALRLLTKRPSFPYSIMILTTKVMGGRSILKSLA